jgi:hypothetical protein
LFVVSIERQLDNIEWWQEWQQANASTIWRPVEADVLLHIEKGIKYPWEYLVVSQWPDDPKDERDLPRVCMCCHRKLKRKDFDRVKTNHTGYSWNCTRCRRKTVRRSWRDVDTVDIEPVGRKLPKAA